MGIAKASKNKMLDWRPLGKHISSTGVFINIYVLHIDMAALYSSSPIAGRLQAGCKTSPLASFVLRESGLGSDPWKPVELVTNKYIHHFVISYALMCIWAKGVAIWTINYVRSNLDSWRCGISTFWFFMKWVTGGNQGFLPQSPWDRQPCEKGQGHQNWWVWFTSASCQLKK